MALDNIDELNVKNASPFPTALRYGVIGGLISIALGLVSYLAGMQGTIPTIINILSTIVTIGVIVYAIRAHRDNDLGGYISYGRCLGTGILAAIIMGLIGAIWTFILFNVIDPGITDMLMQPQMEAMEEAGMSDDDIEKAMSMAGKFMTAPFMAAMALAGSALIGLIVSLIAGAFLKKERGIA